MATTRKILATGAIMIFAVASCDLTDPLIMGFSASRKYGCGAQSSGFNFSTNYDTTTLMIELSACSKFAQSVKDSNFSEPILISNALFSIIEDTIPRVDFLDLSISYKVTKSGRAAINIKASDYYQLQAKLITLSRCNLLKVSNETIFLRMESNSEVILKIDRSEIESILNYPDTKPLPLSAINLVDASNPTVYLFGLKEHTIAYYEWNFEPILMIIPKGKFIDEDLLVGALFTLTD